MDRRLSQSAKSRQLPRHRRNQRNQILHDMMQQPNDKIIVSTKRRGRGHGGWSKNNPYLEEPWVEFKIDIRPASIVQRLLPVREQLAKEFERDLDVVGIVDWIWLLIRTLINFARMSQVGSSSNSIHRHSIGYPTRPWRTLPSFKTVAARLRRSAVATSICCTVCARKPPPIACWGSYGNPHHYHHHLLHLRPKTTLPTNSSSGSTSNKPRSTSMAIKASAGPTTSSTPCCALLPRWWKYRTVAKPSPAWRICCELSNESSHCEATSPRNGRAWWERWGGSTWSWTMCCFGWWWAGQSMRVGMKLWKWRKRVSGLKSCRILLALLNDNHLNVYYTFEIM